MSFEPGAHLGPYEILSQLGAGGMGEVYKARDTRLERTVAIKVLSPALVGDAEFRDRFEREARTISQLTHPHICTLYDIGDQDGVAFLVLEYLEGETLDARLKSRAPVDEHAASDGTRGFSRASQLAIAEALKIGIQIARALHAAHRAGIVHRDLKPGNVMLVKGGSGATSAPQAKLLDFGLAKHGAGKAGGAGGAGQNVAQGFSPADLTASPTMTNPLTMRGSIVGTLQYMSPEQLEGADADARSDMFAFGAVLYEMVTGKKAFTGKSQVSVMAAILDHDPPTTASIVPTVPPALDRLIRKCLAKDPEARWQNAGDVASELEWIAETLPDRSAEGSRSSTATGSAKALRSSAVPWIAAVLVLPTIAAVATWALIRPLPTAKLQPLRFSIVPPAGQPLAVGLSPDRDIAISADGTQMVYVVANGAQRQLMVRGINQLDAVQLRGVSNPRVPFLSPDGNWIGYFDGTELKKVSIAGGPPISICRVNGPPRGASWGPDNTIVFATAGGETGLLSVPAGGGDPKVLTKADTARREQDHFFPSFLPNGRNVLFTITSRAGQSENLQVAVLDLTSGQSKTLLRSGGQAEYIGGSGNPNQPGYLVYAAAGSLRAVRFDSQKLEVLSDPVPVIEQVMTASSGAAEFSMSRSGSLMYVSGTSMGSASRTLAWVGRDGREDPIKAPPRPYDVARLAPDGSRAALQISDEENDIWILDLARSTSTRLTFSPAADLAPVWTPDGRRVMFRSSQDGPSNIYARSADGAGTTERLTTSPNPQTPHAISPDGLRLVLMENRLQTGPDLMTMAMNGNGRTEPLVQTSFVEGNADLSPDGRWIVYTSNESGQSQVYVSPFPNVSNGKWQLSTSGGQKPAWSRTGLEVFYVDATVTLMSVPVRTTPAFSAGTPVKAIDSKFYSGGPFRTYDVSRDGQKFLMIKEPATDRSPTNTQPNMVLIVNWLEELKARLPSP